MTSSLWKPDQDSELPLYRQIVEYVKLQIQNGYWTSGMKLPPQRQLAEQFGVNRSTLNQAYDALKADGILEGTSKAGTRIRSSGWAFYLNGPGKTWNYYMDYGIHKPNHSVVAVINHEEFNPSMIRLSTGEPSPTLYPKDLLESCFVDAMRRLDNLNYLEGRGLLRLREILARRLTSQGLKASPETLLITSGALQSLQLISIGITPRSSSILVEQTSYLQSLNIFQSVGMTLTPLKMDAYGLLPSEIMKHKSRQANFLYTIPTYHNPTGITQPDHRRQALAALCEREQLPIIEDDVYRELWLDEPPPPPIKTYDRTGNILYLGSLSKSLGPGLRIGWILGPEALIERLADIKMQTDYGSSTLSQYAAAEVIENGTYDLHLTQFREQLRERRQAALALLETHLSDLADWTLPKGGFYIWVKFKQPVPMKQLFQNCLKNNFLINPGELYDQKQPNTFRLSYAYASTEELAQGLAFIRSQL